jgi:hypothetical protein
MFLYIDPLFGEGRQPEVRPLHRMPATLNEMYLQAMREHDRDAVQRYRSDSGWSRSPDWRFDRQVIRVALFLQQRLNVGPGDRVAVLLDLRPEWLTVDFAAAGLGAIAVGVPAGLPAATIDAALRDAAPRAVFLSRDSLLRLTEHVGPLEGSETYVVFESPAPSDRVVDFAGLLDLGGALDTPERAARFRAAARRIEPEAPAIRHYAPGADDTVAYTELTQAGVAERLRRHWIERPARKGDIVYLAGPEITLATRLALYARVGDGYSTIVIGGPDRMSRDIAELQPRRVLALGAEFEAKPAGTRAQPRLGPRPSAEEPRTLEPAAGLAARDRFAVPALRDRDPQRDPSRHARSIGTRRRPCG